LGLGGSRLSVVVLWITGYIDAAVARLRAEGHEIRDGGVARLPRSARRGRSATRVRQACSTGEGRSRVPFRCCGGRQGGTRHGSCRAARIREMGR
jgi:hypothetical protein